MAPFVRNVEPSCVICVNRATGHRWKLRGTRICVGRTTRQL